MKVHGMSTNKLNLIGKIQPALAFRDKSNLCDVWLRLQNVEAGI